MTGARETLPCAKPDCDRVVLPEEDHVRIEGHQIRTDDRDGQETMYAHPECWDKITQYWNVP